MTHSKATLLCLTLALACSPLLSPGGARAERFVVHGDNTVTDTTTGLMWQQIPPAISNWAGALSHCESLVLGGHSDWRVPNIKELFSLFDLTRRQPAFDGTVFFYGTNISYTYRYWSSTTRAANAVAAFTVEQTTGSIYPLSKNGTGSVSNPTLLRCVR